MNNTDLIESAIRLRATRNKLREIEDLVVPPFVTKPIACKKDDWNEYIKLKAEYDEATRQKGEVREGFEKQSKEIELEIIKMLPSSETWFVTDCEKLAVGHRSDDWPSSDGTLLLVDNPVISELKQIHREIVR